MRRGLNKRSKKAKLLADSCLDSPVGLGSLEEEEDAGEFPGLGGGPGGGTVFPGLGGAALPLQLQAFPQEEEESD